MSKVKTYVLLHVLIMLFSLSAVCSKWAGLQESFSLSFFFFYGLVLFLLGIYAIFWQQIIKNLPLTTAFANKAVTVIWGMIWGVIFFQEKITVGKAIGCVLIVLGILVYSNSEEHEVSI